MRAMLRHAVAMLRNPRLVALQLFVNAILLVSASFWLLIPEEHVWQLLFAGFSALLILFVFLWLHCGTLVYASNPDPVEFRDAFSIKIDSIKIGRMVWLLIGLFILFCCMRTISSWANSQWRIAGYLYSKAPSSLRPTGGASGYFTALGYIFSVTFWYILPCVFLPIIAARVIGAPVLRGLRTLARWQYWLGMAITTVLGVWLPIQILGWTPGKTLSQQTASLVIRLIVAYLFATAAWLATAGLLGSFVRPRDDGSRTNAIRKTAA
jgi:hypothetical protein